MTVLSSQDADIDTLLPQLCELLKLELRYSLHGAPLNVQTVWKLLHCSHAEGHTASQGNNPSQPRSGPSRMHPHIGGQRKARAWASSGRRVMLLLRFMVPDRDLQNRPETPFLNQRGKESKARTALHLLQSSVWSLEC